MQWSTLHERQWDEGYEQAKAYFEEHGDLDVTKKEKSLSLWINRQRSKYRSGELSCDEISRLSAIDMKRDLTNDIWETCFSEAEQYFKQNNSLDIPATYVTESGLKLGLWYRTQLNLY